MARDTTLELWPADRVRLAHDVVLTSDAMEDRATGRRIELVGAAREFVDALESEESLAHARERLVRTHGWDADVVWRDLLRFVDDLDQHALVQVTHDRSAMLRPGVLALRLHRWLTLDWSRPPATRWPATIPRVVLAVVRSNALGTTAAVVLSAILLLVLVEQGVAGPDGTGKLAMAAVPVALFAVLLLGMAAHESGHLVALRAHAPDRPYFVVVRGLRVSIAHAGLDPRRKAVVALAGPLLGVVATACVALAVATVPSWRGLAMPIALTGLLHLYSLMPWAADGRMIWRRGAVDA